MAPRARRLGLGQSDSPTGTNCSRVGAAGRWVLGFTVAVVVRQSASQHPSNPPLSLLPISSPPSGLQSSLEYGTRTTTLTSFPSSFFVSSLLRISTLGLVPALASFPFGSLASARRHLPSAASAIRRPRTTPQSLQHRPATNRPKLIAARPPPTPRRHPFARPPPRRQRDTAPAHAVPFARMTFTPTSSSASTSATPP